MNTLTLDYGATPYRVPAARPWLLLRLWYRRAHQRHQLAGLSDHQLQDIGISRAEALSEAAKPFWRA